MTKITRFEDTPEYKAFAERYQATIGNEENNPYFIVHDSPLTDKSLMDGHWVLNFGSYNYAAMSGRPEVNEAAIDAIRKYGTSASGSRPIGGEKRFSEIVERNRGGRLAVISRNRDGEGRELDFLRRCAELNNFEADTAKPALSEELTPFGDPDKRIVFFMIPVPGKTPPETETSTAKEK